MLYYFKTSCRMKEYNCERWYIDDDLIRPVEIEADSLKGAILQYRALCENEYGVSISDNAIRTANAMYFSANGVDRQIGLVFTGSTFFDKGDYSGFVKQFIDVWAEIKKVDYVDFEGMGVA